MSRRRGLSREDRVLWSRVARTASPLRPSSPSADDEAPDISSFVAKKVTPAPYQPPPFRVGGSSALPKPSSRATVAPSPAERLASNPVRMDAKTYRRMAQGKLRPEARLDLHGMTLAEAQPELIHFIHAARARGLRLVLVITGKGRGDHGPLPTRPGALRHQVPHWLGSAPLAPLVQQVSAAHLRHGGEGAYYVYLRR
ncbi:Smr/MutS family protein (plasmid) [Paracoccus sp. TK19116]|uniref:Smr/MutS family protein n=1 Tax=Paracoccus albicereus TaxID=2922394 RepID=A0ABT1MP26_9RHOB|nr:Smr/MutS family protein [Paracoccus albicereus]MCQ0969183.1 Smr/MutS family protein [Paracoccus albicereus]